MSEHIERLVTLLKGEEPANELDEDVDLGELDDEDDKIEEV